MEQIIHRHIEDVYEGNMNAKCRFEKNGKAVLGLLIETPDETAEEIASVIGVTKRTIERAFVSLQKKRKRGISWICQKNII